MDLVPLKKVESEDFVFSFPPGCCLLLITELLKDLDQILVFGLIWNHEIDILVEDLTPNNVIAVPLQAMR